MYNGGAILHSESTVEKWLGRFKALIPFIENMVKYGVEHDVVVKMYVNTLNILIDKSYLFNNVNAFLPNYKYINSLGIKLSEVAFCRKERLVYRIKILLSRCIGLRNVVCLQGLKSRLNK